jgi:hypothetical protein
MRKLVSWFARHGQLELRENDSLRQSTLMKVTGWTILRAITLGIVLAVVLNVLIGYLGTFRE